MVTIIEFKVAVPDGKRMYTHVNMKNGDYSVLTKIGAIKYQFENNPPLEMGAFNLDGITVTVSGSMYDDRN